MSLLSLRLLNKPSNSIIPQFIKGERKIHYVCYNALPSERVQYHAVTTRRRVILTQRRSHSFLGDTWKKLKQTIKPDPMYEVKDKVNQMIDENTKGFTGISGFFARKLIKKFAQLTIEESHYQIQWIHQIKHLAEEAVLLEKENVDYFGSKIEVVNVKTMHFLQTNGNNYFELRCPIVGSLNERKGMIFMKGHMSPKKGKILFDEIRTYDEGDKMIARQSFDEEDQEEYYMKHPQRRKVIDIKGTEVK